MNSIRMERCRDRQFVEPCGKLNVVNDRMMLYKPGLYGWKTENPAVHFDRSEFESELAFIPRGYISIKGNLVKRLEFVKKNK